MSDPSDARTARSFEYDETMRVLNRQATVLSELRDRANILLAANAIAASLFGASALGKGHPLPLKILALIAFGVGVGVCIAILWSVRDRGISLIRANGAQAAVAKQKTPSAVAGNFRPCRRRRLRGCTRHSPCRERRSAV